MSTLQSTNPWLNSASHSGLVNLGSHASFLRVSGPARVAGQAVVIIEGGLGGMSSECVVASRLIAKFARLYSYDRAGYGQSKPLSPSSLPLTAKRRCEELTKLLEVVGVEPPWIVVGHGYGSVLVREFLLMHGEEKVVGMCIVDSATTRTKLPDSWPELLGDSSYGEVVELEKNRILSDQEWAAMKADGEGISETVAAEEKEMPESTEKINHRIREGGRLLVNKEAECCVL